MPDPAPVMVLSRLAVDKTLQGRGIGVGLLRDAILRTVQAAEIAGIRAILVHAISGATKRFYESCGFYRVACRSADGHDHGRGGREDARSEEELQAELNAR